MVRQIMPTRKVDTCQELAALEVNLEHIWRTPCPAKVFVGFDGFVDKIKKAVKQRAGKEPVFYSTLKEFASRIESASGKSGQVEMVTIKTKLGGNGPILANTLGSLGVQSYCVGSMGYPELDPLFGTMTDKCHIISVNNPGRSEAVEFADGKMIFSELKVFDQYDWKYIKEKIGIDRIRQAVLDSRLLALVDWVNLPHATDLWQGILQDVIKPSGRRDFLFYFDLCDPSKKTTMEIDEVLDLIACFTHRGKVTVGLNENETMKIWGAIHGLDVDQSGKGIKLPSVQEAGEALFKSINIDRLLIHLVDRSMLFKKDEMLEISGRYIERPKVQTGGGDNLNAGFCLGQLYDLPMEQCVLLGMAASGFYVQAGESADLGNLLEYIHAWKNEIMPTKQKKLA